MLRNVFSFTFCVIATPFILLGADSFEKLPLGVDGKCQEVCQGPRGPIGPAGPQGDVGPQGPVGPSGPIGPTGPQGDVGPQGAVGPIGSTGPTGPQGPVGPSGLDGPIGPTGPTGTAGPAGPDGASGARGPTGATGVTGPTGSTGPTGTIAAYAYFTNHSVQAVAASGVINLTTMETEFGGFSLTGTGVTVPATGVYLIKYQVNCDSSVISVFIRGSITGNIGSTSFGNNGGNSIVTGSAIQLLAAGETLTLMNNNTVTAFNTNQSSNTAQGTIPVGLSIMRLQ